MNGMRLFQSWAFLGKYIYILDAYDDLEKDVEKRIIICLFHIWKQPDFDNYVGNLLNSIMAECARYFERLPIINDVEIFKKHNLFWCLDAF